MTSSRLEDIQRRGKPVRVSSPNIGRLTLTRHTAVDMDGDTDAGAGWLSTRAGARLASGELVPGTRFKIIRWIGEGGMGQVFEAVHVDIQRLVALKVLKSSLGITPDLCASFLAEARACAKVESRFVVSVLDFGVLPDDRPFFVMELLAQGNLHTELEQGPMPLERAIPILRQTCKALGAIHKAGLVHRDLKPENLVIQAEDGRGDTVRLVDFGIATEPGTETRVSGTPSYMAPEQIRGAGFDARIDIYAFGCMATEMLTGSVLFEGSLFDIFEAQLEQTPPRISERREGLPPELDALVLKCLAKRPEDRWANVHELEAALCEVQILAGFVTPWDDLAMPEIDEDRRESLIARMPRATAGRARFRKRWWVGLGVGALTIGALGLVLGTSLDADEVRGQMEPLEAPADTHVQELSNAVRLAASRAYWVYPPINDRDQPTALHLIGELEAVQGAHAAQALELATQERREIASTLVRFGDKYWDVEHGRSFAVEYYALALMFMPDQPRALERSTISPAQLADVVARAQRGDFTPAELHIAEVMVTLAEEDPERLHERVVALIEDDAAVLSLQTRESLAQLAEASPVTPKPDAGAVTVTVTGTETGTDTSDSTDGGDAGDQYKQADQARDVTKAAALVVTAERALIRGDRAEAEQLFNEAISHNNRSVGALSGLASLYFDAGDYGTALGYARKASRLQPNSGDLHMLVGDCYLKVLRYADARAAYQQGLARQHPRAAERISYIDGLTD